jgi:hypothetical protein
MKGQIQQFAWIFSVIVGAIILFLTFFFLSQYAKQVEKPTRQITIASGLNLLLEPFSAISNIAEVRAEILEIPKDYYIEIGCERNYNTIKARKIEEKYFEISEKVLDKYIFSKPFNSKKNKKFIVYSVPIEIPFHVGNAIIIVTNETCLADLPYKKSDLENTLAELEEIVKEEKIPKINFSCRDENRYNAKNGYGNMAGKYWIRSMVSAAVFSDKDLYDCNLNRILDRAIRIAELLEKKAQIASQYGCNYGNIMRILEEYKENAENFKKNRDNLGSFYTSIKKLEDANRNLNIECKLF